MSDSPPPPKVGAVLTQKQEATLAYTLENDSDEWLVVLAGFVESRGADSEALKAGLLEGGDAWQARVKAVKAQGFEALAVMATERQTLWMLTIRQLLSDAGQINCLRAYLNALIMLKTAKIKEFGPRGEIRKQFNNALSFLANEAYSTLEKYLRAGDMLHRTSGPALTPEARAFYTTREQETARQLGALLATLIMFRQATTPEASDRLKRFVQEHLIVPLDLHARVVPVAEQKPIRDQIGRYRALLQAVEVAR